MKKSYNKLPRTGRWLFCCILLSSKINRKANLAFHSFLYFALFSNYFILFVALLWILYSLPVSPKAHAKKWGQVLQQKPNLVLYEKTSPPQSCPRTYWTLQNKCALLLWQHFVDSKWSTITLEIFCATLLPRRMFFILYLYISFLLHKCSTLHLFSLNFILLTSSSPFNFSR